MIKGINKQILEVTNPESPYFEKIIFFVSPNGAANDEKVVQQEAIKISKSVRKPPKTKATPKQILQRVLMMALGIGAGVSVGIMLNYFMG